MKAYVKPALFYERYEVSQHIADCQWELKNQNDINSCVAQPDKGFWGDDYTDILATEQPRCDVTNYQDYCYQNGADGVNLLQS